MLAVALKIKVQTERYGYRNPAEVEKASQKVGYRAVVLCEKLIRRERSGCCRDAEKLFLSLIEVTNVYRVDHVIGVKPHHVIGTTKQGPGG